MAGQVAVIPLVTVEEIQDLRRDYLQTKSMPPWQLNNTALKFLRDSNENPPGVPQVVEIDLTPEDEVSIGVLARNKGMAYTFVEGEFQQWSWRGI